VLGAKGEAQRDDTAQVAQGSKSIPFPRGLQIPYQVYTRSVAVKGDLRASGEESSIFAAFERYPSSVRGMMKKKRLYFGG
jgi:hypothetical protein